MSRHCDECLREEMENPSGLPSVSALIPLAGASHMAKLVVERTSKVCEQIGAMNAIGLPQVG